MLVRPQEETKFSPKSVKVIKPFRMSVVLPRLSVYFNASFAVVDSSNGL